MTYLRFQPLRVSLLAALLLLPLATFAQQTNSLETYKALLQRQEQGLLIQYSNNLSKVIETLKQYGQLDAFLIFDAERKRFSSEQTVPELANMFESYRPQVELYYKSKADLLRKYSTALNGLIKSLMMRNKIDEAKEVQAEIEKTVFLLNTIESDLQKQTAIKPDPPVLSSKTNSSPSPRKTTFRILGSQMDSGTWKPTNVKVQSGDYIQVEAELTDSIKNQKGIGGRFTLRTKSATENPCSFYFNAGSDRGKIERQDFTAEEDSLLVYATENKISLKVTVTIGEKSSDVNTKEFPSGGSIPAPVHNEPSFPGL